MPERTTAGRWAAAGRAIARVGLHLVLPPTCLACAEPTTDAGTLCPKCWREMRFITAPCCARCGRPLGPLEGANGLCADCVEHPPVFDRARAVFLYKGTGPGLIIAFKMNDRSYLAPRLAEWLHRAAAPLLADADLVAPVPMRRRRLFARRFNQSAILAQFVARRAGKAVAPDLLVCTRRTPPQVRLSGRERRRNLRGVFAVRRRRMAEVAGRRILLVDDVLTTGSTVSECARALRRAGAAAVDVATLAQVPPPQMTEHDADENP